MAVVKKKSVNEVSYHNLIQFIPSTSSQTRHPEKKTNKYGQSQDDEVLGKEAKAFYETLLSESEHSSSTLSVSHSEGQTPISDERINDNFDRRRKKSNRISHLKPSNVDPSADNEHHSHSEKEFFQFQQLDSGQRQHLKLLQNAQLGHIHEVKDLLKSGLNLNFQDFYGWTPLMCSANEGHLALVKFLLESGSERNLCNSTGDNASSIARNAGHLEIAELIMSFEKRRKRQEFHEIAHSLEFEAEKMFYCDTCKQEFSLQEQKSHYSSTVHLFNSGKRKSGPTFLISESNRGFQMLLRSGWTGDGGLGPEGKGVKYPVKTILKQDRKGLGSEQDNKKKAKISHFDAKDERAVKSTFLKRRDLSVRTLAKNAQKSKDKRKKRWEMNLRYEFS